MSTNGIVRWAPFEEPTGQVRLVQVTDDATLLRHWPWLYPRLKAARANDRSGFEQWTPEHVRESVRRGFMGQAPTKLWLGVDQEGAIAGFIVTTVRYDVWVALPAALVAWVLWANQALVENCVDQLKAIARAHYLNRIEFIAARRGWWKKAGWLKRLGFEMKFVHFAMDLGEPDAR